MMPYLFQRIPHALHNGRPAAISRHRGVLVLAQQMQAFTGLSASCTSLFFVVPGPVACTRLIRHTSIRGSIVCRCIICCCCCCCACCCGARPFDIIPGYMFIAMLYTMLLELLLVLPLLATRVPGPRELLLTLATPLGALFPFWLLDLCNICMCCWCCCA